MRTRTLILGGLATCTAGLLGGIAANPVMRPIEGADWRARYRAPVDRASDPVMGEFALAGWRPYFTQADQPAEPPRRLAMDDPVAADVPLEQPVPDDPWAAHGPKADLGRLAVAAALEATAGIGAAPPAVDQPEIVLIDQAIAAPDAPE